jgi:hypothetical protein
VQPIPNDPDRVRAEMARYGITDDDLARLNELQDLIDLERVLRISLKRRLHIHY